MLAKQIIISPTCQPPDIKVTFYVDRELDSEVEDYIIRLASSWYDIGVHCGFGDGCLHDMEKVAFGDNDFSISVDLGSAPFEAVEKLVKIMTDALTMYKVSIQKVTVS